MGRPRVELTGKKFERLTVIKLSHIDGRRQRYWLCKCDCGNEKIIRGASLQNGATRSCGCLRKETNRRLSEGIAARNVVIRGHKTNAKIRNLEQALTDEQIIAIHKENCHYCGVPPSTTRFHPNCTGSYTHNGIDRVDNNKGYTIDNVVSCCKICNYAKREMSYDEFINWLKRVHSHLKL